MTQLDYPAKATQIWNAMDTNERAGVRFGLFPFDKMQAAAKEGYKGQELCVALMAQANSAS